MSKKIYRDFNHWFSESHAHGMSSASRDWLEEIWNEILPTIEASRDDYKNSYIQLMKDEVENRSEVVDALHAYIDAHKRPGDPRFARWWLDQMEKKDEV